MSTASRTPLGSPLQTPESLARKPGAGELQHRIEPQKLPVLGYWLNRVHFQESHSLLVSAPADQVWQAVRDVDLRLSWMNRLCLSLRMSHSLLESGPEHWDGGYSLRQLPDFGFVPLESIKGERILFGLAGRFWESQGAIVKFDGSDAFRRFRDKRFVRFVWGFTISPAPPEKPVAEPPKRRSSPRKRPAAAERAVRLTTDTWVECLSDDAHWFFTGHWGMVRPFNGLVRRQMLRSIKEAAEDAARNRNREITG